MFGKSIPTFGRRSMFGGFARSSSTITSAEKNEMSIDQKCEAILKEMERCQQWSHRHIESSILHNVPQIFVTKDLYGELEAELDRLLMEQLIKEELDGWQVPESEELIIHECPDEHRDDVDFCAACNRSPCEWKPPYNTDELAKRKKELYQEVQMHQDMMIESTTARGSLNKSVSNIVLSDSMEKISNEIKKIDASMALCSIDKELHQVYATANESVTVNSIHGFPTTVQRDNAIHALEFEHNRLIAKELANETIESVLDWMLKGWYFGEPENDEQTAIWADEMFSHEERGTLRSRANSIQLSSNTDAIRAANVREETKDNLKSIENSMRYGIFCLTFMYFRALHLVRREKETWRGAHDAVTMAKRAPLNAERLKMIDEERNAAYRKARMDDAMEKARKGEERKRLRLERERLEKARILHWDSKKRRAADSLALALQRIYRGHIGRKVAKTQYLQQDKIRSANILVNACATAIARTWRGYCGRQDARHLRKEMAKFLFAIREEEARDEEEEYLAAQKWFG